MKKTIERWKPIKDYEEFYEISTYGRVKSLRRKKIMVNKPLGGKGRYLAICLSNAPNKGRYVLVHRLVAGAFIKNPKEKPCVNHINNNPEDNHVENLEWVTYRENTQHGIDNGLVNKRRGMTTKVLDKLQIKAINILWASEEISQRKIALLLDIPETTINTLIRKNL